MYSRTKSSALIVLAGALAVLGISLLACPTLLRMLPGRYAYYLPAPLQELRRIPHPETLPTPAISPALTLAVVRLPSPIPPTSTPAPSLVWTPAETVVPTATPSPTPTATPTLPPRVVLSGIRFEHQWWNNCGPATLGMALSYWGRDETQRVLAPLLKPDPEDKHVAMWEMEGYVKSIGMGAIVRVNGTVERLKALIQGGFPVIVASWHVRDRHDQLGHYRLVVGYDDGSEQFILYDSLEGPDYPIGYRALDELWRVYNRAYLVVYPLDRWEAVAAILGADVDTQGMYERALERAQFEAAHPPQDCVAYAACEDWVTFSWFNVGSSLTALGRHAEAAAAYDQARRLGLPYRMLWYQPQPYECYYAVGRYADVVALADATLITASNLEESYYWRGKARLALGDVEGARADFQAALHYHRDWAPALAALNALDAAPPE